MIEYENEFSRFPVEKITKHNFKNIDDTIAPLINKINSLRAQGYFGEATSIIQENKDTLSQCIVDAVTFRTWEEEIYNAQKYAKQQQQSIYFELQEPDCIKGDVWIGGD